jgi:uncharacterized membrane protein
VIEQEAIETEPYDEALAPPINRMAVAIFALAGALIAGYLMLYKLNVLGSIACGTGSCETVQASPWATFLKIPVPLWGLGGYVTILGLAIAGLQPRWIESRALAALLLGLVTYAFGFSMYLTAIEAFRLHAWCRWCIGSAVAATLMFLSVLPELPRVLKREMRNDK